MKKKLALVLAAAMVSVSLAACGGSAPETAAAPEATEAAEASESAEAAEAGEEAGEGAAEGEMLSDAFIDPVNDWGKYD